MDRFERLRYQSEERQRELLEEMIETEILAQEARRLGLDKDPDVQLRLMQALRNEVLEDLRRQLPRPEDIPETEVREYYSQHQGDFVEPERRRVLVIEVSDAKLAADLATQAQGASGEEWAKWAKKHSRRRDRLGDEDANELAGDVGFLSPPGSPPDERRGESPDLPEAVRKAAFQLAKVGEVSPKPVEEAGRYYVVRLAAISPKRDRSLRDAGPAIRAELLRLKFAEAEKQLLADLAKQYPARIDEAALNRAARGAEK
jgi:hypothetical protein